MTNFGFTISALATIVGILVELSLSVDDNPYVNNLQLLKAGTATGTDLGASGGNNGPWGGSSTMWGTTWTPAQVNASNFGFQFQGTLSDNADTGYCGGGRITIYYTLPGTGGPFPFFIDEQMSGGLQELGL